MTTAAPAANTEVITPPTVGDLVVNALNDNPAGMGGTFDTLMADRIRDAIASKKIEVAQNTFGSREAPPEDEQVETPPAEGTQNGEDAQANTVGT